MPRLLRMIDPKKWLFDDELDFEVGDCHPDTLYDLKTTKRTLSFYFVDTEEDIQTIITGLASSRSIQELSFVLLDESTIEDSGYEIIYTLGITPYDAANKLHRDVIIKSGRELVKMVGVILPFLANDENFDLISKHQIKKILNEAKDSQLLDLNTIHSDVKKKIYKID